MSILSLLMSLVMFTTPPDFGVVEGVVVDDEGPLAGAVVMIGQTTLAVTTDAEGRFRLEEVPVGKQQLVVRFVGFKMAESEVSIEAGVTANLTIKMEADVLGLEEVVVSANRYESNRKEAPVVVSNLGKKLKRATQSLSLDEGLNFQPGLRVETNCQNCGFTQVRMNGLEGPYTQILVNSRPVFSSLICV